MAKISPVAITVTDFDEWADSTPVMYASQYNSQGTKLLRLMCYIGDRYSITSRPRDGFGAQR